jgi:hypothetical protein
MKNKVTTAVRMQHEERTLRTRTVNAKPGADATDNASVTEEETAGADCIRGTEEDETDDEEEEEEEDAEVDMREASLTRKKKSSSESVKMKKQMIGKREMNNISMENCCLIWVKSFSLLFHSNQKKK